MLLFRANRVLIERSQVYNNSTTSIGMHLNSPDLMASPRETIIPSGAPIRIILGAKTNPKHFYGHQHVQQQTKIFSQPIPQPKINMVSARQLGDNLYEEATFNCNYDMDNSNSHVNYGYDMTVTHASGKPLISTVTIPPVSNVIINQNRMVVVSAKSASNQPATSKSQSGQKSGIKIDDLLSKNFLLVDPNSSKPKPGFVKNMAALANSAAATLRKDNSQHLPQSIEKPMAKNFKSLNVGVPPKAVPDSEEESSSAHSQASKGQGHEETRHNDSTSLSITDQSLRDEDAWLPILNIAEEQVSPIIDTVQILTLLT